MDCKKIKSLKIVIVLSHLMNEEGILSEESQERGNKACLTAKEIDANYLITNGWDYRKDCKVKIADAFIKYINSKHNLRDLKLLSQKYSRDTVGDAIFSKLMVEEINLKLNCQSELFVITTDYHMDRASFIFSSIYNYKINFISTKIKGLSNSDLEIIKKNEILSIRAFQKTFPNIFREKININELYDRLVRNHPYYNGSNFSKMPKLEKVISEFKKEIENN